MHWPYLEWDLDVGIFSFRFSKYLHDPGYSRDIWIGEGGEALFPTTHIIFHQCNYYDFIQPCIYFVIKIALAPPPPPPPIQSFIPGIVL